MNDCEEDHFGDGKAGLIVFRDWFWISSTILGELAVFGAS